ncbi:MAG: ATP-binding protein [Myxococcota bacterium]
MSLRIPVHEASQIGQVRREAIAIAAAAGLDPTSVGRAALIATELATNLVRHAVRGEIHAATVDGGIELLAIDGGPGTDDVDAWFRDGYSTFGSSGIGLGAIRRQSDAFDAYSRAGIGTVVLSRVGAQRGDALVVGAVEVPYPGEVVSGDAWRFAAADGEASILMVDGLGHGAGAADAAAIAVGAFDGCPFRSPAALLAELHPVMIGSRGGAASIARLDPSAGTIRFAGVGNVCGWITSRGATRGMMAYNGTLGLAMPRVRDLEFTFAPDFVGRS